MRRQVYGREGERPEMPEEMPEARVKRPLRCANREKE